MYTWLKIRMHLRNGNGLRLNSFGSRFLCGNRYGCCRLCQGGCRRRINRRYSRVRMEYDECRHNSSCRGHGGRRPTPHRNHTALFSKLRRHAFPNPWGDFLFCVLKVPYILVKLFVHLLLSFISSCNLSRARCSLEREVASVHPSSSAISLWE